jgi:hypothetical protein
MLKANDRPMLTRMKSPLFLASALLMVCGFVTAGIACICLARLAPRALRVLVALFYLAQKSGSWLLYAVIAKAGAALAGYRHS